LDNINEDPDAYVNPPRQRQRKAVACQRQQVDKEVEEVSDDDTTDTDDDSLDVPTEAAPPRRSSRTTTPPEQYVGGQLKECTGTKECRVDNSRSARKMKMTDTCSCFSWSSDTI
jgi:hypothetical protein